MLKTAINGFGRIGRTFFRAAKENNANFEIVAINNPGWDEKTFQHLLKYDTVYGKFDADLKGVKLLKEKDPSILPWKKLDVDIVIDSTGIFINKQDAIKHIAAGAKKVIISAPSKDSDIMIVMGVNEEKYQTGKHKIISMASCTTNCLAPIVKILQTEYGIEKGFMTTVHSYTADQNLQDGSHRDFRRARAAAQNIVPTTTGAAKAIFQVVEGLENKLDGLALRVPTITVSINDLVCVLKKKTTSEELNKKFKQYAEGKMKGVLAVSGEPLVSSDYIKNPYSSIVDSSLTNVIGENLAKVTAWYDNEWGYSCRLVDLINYIQERGI